MHQKSRFVRLCHKNRGVLFPVAIVCLLASLPLTSLLPFDYVWKIVDSVRTLAFMLCAWWLTVSIPYARLREKCLAAAVFGYLVADLIICFLWYVLHIRNEIEFIVLHFILLVSYSSLYAIRSYDLSSDEIEDGHIYCLRKIPRSAQDFVISLSGLFGSDGSYAIYCNGYVYKFRKGVLVKLPYAKEKYNGYHIRQGAISTNEMTRELDQMIGAQWELFGKNCLTLLGRFWRRANG